MGDGWFTFNNTCVGGYLIASRIDRFLVIENIMRGMGEINSSFLSAASSEHWPISLKWDWLHAILRKPFRLEQF